MVASFLSERNYSNQIIKNCQKRFSSINKNRYLLTHSKSFYSKIVFPTSLGHLLLCQCVGGGNLKRVDDESELVAPSSITAGGGGAGGAAYYCTDCGCYFTDEDGTVAEDYMIGMFSIDQTGIIIQRQSKYNFTNTGLIEGDTLLRAKRKTEVVQ